MKVTTRGRAKAPSGAAKGGASAIRDLIDSRGSTVKEAQKQASTTVSEAQKQARDTIKDARKEARRKVTRARIAAARVRAGGRTKASGISSKAVGAAGAAGLAAGYFLDPDSGKRRRNVVRDRAAALIGRGAQPEKPGSDDQALAERVRSEIFQPADAPKGSVNVNVEHGVVYLRGEVKRPEQIRKLIEQAGSVDGVAGVENLLHTA
jgi:osmotically-inducible protein OsmY